MTEVARGDSYASVRTAFAWRVPERYSIAWDICGRWAAAEPDRTALVELGGPGGRREWTYGALDRESARIANALRADAGLRRGDRCAVLLPQSAATVLAHVAIYRIGAIAVPLFRLFGPDAIEYRLRDSGAAAIIADIASLPKLSGVRDRLPALRRVYAADGEAEGAVPLEGVAGRAAAECPYEPLAAEDPSFLSYTSGTTGPPKGALHAQRVLLGHIPGVQLPHEWLPQPGDRMWTPADWAWMGGLTNVMMPALRFGVPLVAWRAAKFDPLESLAMMRRERVRNVFLPPTALRMMRQAAPAGGSAYPRLRSVASGGEALGAETLEWGREAFGLTINEFYGQTECNLVVGNCASLFPPRPGSAGRPLPGHAVAAIDPSGAPLPPDETGELAVRAPDPVMFLRYWNREDATRGKFAGAWMRTGDLGALDTDGYVHFLARTDDVITSSGYRIGPSEIEDCLAAHPAVALAGVIGVRDSLRTELVTAFIVAAPGREIGDALADELRAHVRSRIGGHAAPRRLEFVESLPLTATGKVMRRVLRDRAGSVS